MRKAISTLLTLTMGLGIVSCAAKAPAAEEGFRPALDTSTSCQINIAGGYDNFEALESEFDRFNTYYPNVELKYTKIDDYRLPSIMPRIWPTPHSVLIWAASGATSY